jgi:hypothetical protein
MTVLSKTLLAALLISVGFAAGFAARSRRGDEASPAPDAWLVGSPMPRHGSGGAISYTDEAFLKADVPLPEIETLDAKIKFVIGSPEGAGQGRSVGSRPASGFWVQPLEFRLPGGFPRSYFGT